MRPIATLTLIASVVLALASQTTFADEPKGDLAKLQGSWTAKVGTNNQSTMVLTVKGKTIEQAFTGSNGKGSVLTCEMTVDETASPKTFDWTKTKVPNGNELPPNLGIYKLDGDSWTICVGGVNRQRPTEFKAGEVDLPRLTTFTRVKEKADENPIKDDLAKLQGSWTAKVGPDSDIPITLAIKGNAIALEGSLPDGDELKLKGEIKVDEKASPKALDWIKFTDPQGQELPGRLAIYKLDGDTWTVCSGGNGNDRPTKFEAGEDGLPMLTTFTRVKEKPEDKPLKGDLAKFQGTWLAPAGANDEVMITMTVKVNAYTATWDQGDGTKVELKGELRMNDLAKPKTIDFFNTKRNDGEDARDSLGIYEFDGDKIKLCVGGGGEERPTEFKKGIEGTPHLLTFTKKKD